MNMKTVASTTGIDRATTAPARNPRLKKLIAITMTSASHSDSHEVVDRVGHHVRLVRHQMIGSIPIGRSA